MKSIIIFLIRVYQWLSPVRKAIMLNLFQIDKSCRFQPSCSEYMAQAVQRHGVVRGLHLGLKRLGSCHPFGSSGYDPVR